MSASARRGLSLLFVLFALVLAGCDVDLYTNLAERDANAMVATLQRGGIPASRDMQEDGPMRVRVDRDRFAEAVRVLEDAGLPRQDFASMGQIFQRDGLVASPTQERAQMLYALSEELSRTVSEIDGVLSARVHIVLPDNDPLRRETSPSSASVFIRHDAGLAVDPLVPQIKTLVANGIAGLSYDMVSVVSVAAPTPAPNASAPQLVSIMGVWVLEASASRAMWIVGVLGVLVFLFAAGLGFLFWRQRGRHTYELVPHQ